MNKKANWELPAIFGVAGLGMIIDALWLRILLPANRLFEGIIGILLILLAIKLHYK